MEGRVWERWVRRRKWRREVSVMFVERQKARVFETRGEGRVRIRARSSTGKVGGGALHGVDSGSGVGLGGGRVAVGGKGKASSIAMGGFVVVGILCGHSEVGEGSVRPSRRWE